MGERCAATRLQSALALLHARPELLRAELLRAAREFASGDPAVEDFLWLPFALTRYVTATGDHELLSTLPFGDDAGNATTNLAATDDLYLHCVHGLRGSLRFGTRGLPPAAAILHDQTPGGQGESVRLAFFMTATLQRFAELADRRGDFGFATTCRGAALALGAQCEEHGWDGEWYRWCYLENGNVLGAAANPACRVDLLTQGWAVLAGAPRAFDALQAATRRLADEAQGTVALCEPAVDGHWAERVAAWPGQDHRALALAVLGFARLGDAQVAWHLARLLDPLARSSTQQDCARYAAPPYFVSAGMRTIAPYPGRAIGDCFTSAAAWSWLALAEGLLGVRRNGSQLSLRPRLAPEWDGLCLHYRHHGAIYEITVRAGADRDEVLLDGQPCADGIVPLAGDRRDHRVEVRIADAASDRGPV
jgi:cellobiose phosphorylase